MIATNAYVSNTTDDIRTLGCDAARMARTGLKAAATLRQVSQDAPVLAEPMLLAN